MNLSLKERLKTKGFHQSFENWPVADEWKQELYNYFILGYPPGSFHTACFENNLTRAAFNSHVSNRWEDIRAMMKWVYSNAPKDSWGSVENVENWLKLSVKKRAKICLEHGFTIPDKEVTWKMLEA